MAGSLKTNHGNGSSLGSSHEWLRHSNTWRSWSVRYYLEEEEGVESGPFLLETLSFLFGRGHIASGEVDSKIR